jgi:hypothetical protein
LLNEVLEAAAKIRRASSNYVFPPVRASGPFTSFPWMIDRLVQEAGTERFGLHDLRRTCRTVMGSHDIDDQTQRACVGQKAPAFDQKYNKDDGWHRRCFAFNVYHQFLRNRLDGKPVDNVLAFSRANNPEAQLERQFEEWLREHRAQALAAG